MSNMLCLFFLRRNYFTNLHKHFLKKLIAKLPHFFEKVYIPSAL